MQAADRGHTSAVIYIEVGKVSCLVSFEGGGNCFPEKETRTFRELVGHLEEYHGFKVSCSRESNVRDNDL